MHFHAGQPFQMYSSHENTPVCKFAENGPKVKPPTVKAPRYIVICWVEILVTAENCWD